MMGLVDVKEDSLALARVGFSSHVYVVRSTSTVPERLYCAHYTAFPTTYVRIYKQYLLGNTYSCSVLTVLLILG